VHGVNFNRKWESNFNIRRWTWIREKI